MEKTNLFYINTLKDCEQWIMQECTYIETEQHWEFSFGEPRFNMRREYWFTIMNFLKDTPDNIRWLVIRQMMPFLAVCYDIRTGFSWQQMLWSTFLQGMRPASSHGYIDFLNYLASHNIEPPKGLDFSPIKLTRTRPAKELKEIYQKNA